MNTLVPILEVKKLRKLYRNGRGVKDISFTLSQGDIFGLLGSNGSGKTTAIRSICGLCPFEGEIFIYGESVAENPREALRRVSGIVEAPSFYANLTAEQNLLLATKYYGVQKKDTAEMISWALDIVKLSKNRRERVERFSLGMKARLGLALCFISAPGFMALDEPLNGLDIEGMVEVRNIILSQASVSGAVFLISSHLASEIEKTCNRVGVMDEGELLETAHMADVMRIYGSVEEYYLSVLYRRRRSELTVAGGGKIAETSGVFVDAGASGGINATTDTSGGINATTDASGGINTTTDTSGSINTTTDASGSINTTIGANENANISASVDDSEGGSV